MRQQKNEFRRGGRPFLIIFACFGLFAFCVAIRNEWPNRRSFSWSPLEATVVRSKVSRSDSDLWLDCQVQYARGGKMQLAQSVLDELDQGPVRGSYADLSFASETLYAPGQRVTVYVDPTDPSRIVLGRNIVAWVWLPAFLSLFVLLPLAMVFTPEPVVNKLIPKLPWAIAFVFIGVGVLFLVRETIPHLHRAVSVSKWQPTEATSIDAWIAVSRGRRSTRYRAAAIYEYASNGRTYRSDQLTIRHAYRKRKVTADELKRFEPGAVHRVYVNPANPREAVLDRTFYLADIILLLPLVFITIGGAVLYLTLRNRSIVRRTKKKRDR